MKSRTIVFIAGDLGLGGAEKQLYYIIQCTLELGYKVILIANTKGEYWEGRIRDLGVEVENMPPGNPLSKLRWLTGFCKKRKPDLIYSQHSYTSIYAALVGIRLGIPSLGSSRNELLSEVNAHKYIGKYIVKLPKWFVANSLQSATMAVSHLGRKPETVFYLPNAIDASQLFGIEAVPAPVFRLLCVARIYKQKRFDRLLDIYAQLLKQNPNCHLTILGDGQEYEAFKQAMVTLALESKVTHIRKDTEVAKYYANADAFILVSDHEGTPNVVMEAMAAGLPVLATSVGNIPNLIEEGRGGYLVKPENGIDLIPKILHLIEHPELRLEMGEHNRQFIQSQHSIEALQGNLFGIYSKIFGDK